MNTNPLTYKSTPIFLPINRDVFIEGIKGELFENKLSELQLECIDLILYEAESQGVWDLRHIAYLFAIAYYYCHNPFKESHDRMTPMHERGTWATLKGKGEYPYFGRSFSMIHRKSLYRSEGLRMNLDLEYDPDLMLIPKVAANSHVYCMSNGIYFTRKLSDFISGKMCDYNKAMRIVGETKNRFIVSKYALQFEYWLRKSAIDI